KHSPPFIAQGVQEMRDAGIEQGVGLVLAPHWSGMSVESYVERVEKAVAETGGPAFTYVRQWYDHPMFVEFLASRIDQALDSLDPSLREGALVIFSAHSLPTREIEDGARRCKLCTSEACRSGCRYVARWCAARPGSSRTTWRSSSTSTSRRVGMPRTSGWRSPGPRCPTPTPRS